MQDVDLRHPFRIEDSEQVALVKDFVGTTDRFPTLLLEFDGPFTVAWYSGHGQRQRALPLFDPLSKNHAPYQILYYLQYQHVLPGVIGCFKSRRATRSFRLGGSSPSSLCAV
jgi:hypothetical protein